MAGVILYSRRLRRTRGGVELFNENLQQLLGPSALHADETSIEEPLVRSYVSRLWKTARLLKGTPDAAIIVQYGSFLDIAVLPVLRAMTSRLFVICHVSSTWKHLSSPFGRAFTKFVLVLTCRRVLVLSEDQQAVFKGLRTTKIRTIIHPVFAEGPTGESQARSGFAFVGRVTPEKGVFDLVAAWAQLGDNPPRLRLYGRGDADLVARLQAEIDKHGLADTVTLEGPVGDPSTLRTIYRSHVAVVYPSYADAFPLVMLESLSQGTPCIISVVGEVPNFMGSNELLVKPGDISAIVSAVRKVQHGDIDHQSLAMLQARSKQFAEGTIIQDLRAADVL